MGKLYQTARGKKVDMEAMILKNEHAQALGNASMNARGDIIKNGKILKSRADVVQEYYQSNPSAVQVSLKKELPNDFFQTPAEAIEQIKEKATRKIVEKED